MADGDPSRSLPPHIRFVVTAEPAGSAASRPAPDADELIDRFAGRYTNPGTARQYRSELTALFAFAGVSHPGALTDGVVNHWVAQGRANNTRRTRLARVCTFLRWCVRQGQADPALVEELQSRDNPLRATPSLYGKIQGRYPAR